MVLVTNFIHVLSGCVSEDDFFATVAELAGPVADDVWKDPVGDFKGGCVGRDDKKSTGRNRDVGEGEFDAIGELPSVQGYRAGSNVGEFDKFIKVVPAYGVEHDFVDDDAASDINRHGGFAGSFLTIAGSVGEGIGASKVRIRFVGEGTIRRESERSSRDVIDEGRRDTWAIYVDVIGKNSPSRVHYQDLIQSSFVGVIPGARPIIDRCDGDGHGREIGTLERIVGTVSEAISAIKVSIGDINKGALESESESSIAWLTDEGDCENVEVLVIGEKAFFNRLDDGRILGRDIGVIVCEWRGVDLDRNSHFLRGEETIARFIREGIIPRESGIRSVSERAVWSEIE